MNGAIKLRTDEYCRYNNWKDILDNLGSADIPVVCYNLMPVLDWTRADVMYRLDTGRYAARFDKVDFAACDIFALKPRDAEQDYGPGVVSRAETRARELSPDGLAALETAIIDGLPAHEEVHPRDGIATRIAAFGDTSAETLRAQLIELLREIVTVAEDVGVRLGIHADDPPFSLFGLPRVVSSAEETRAILAPFDDPECGMTFCTGSYGARADNDLVAMVKEFGPRIHFTHLRNVKLQEDGSLYEAAGRGSRRSSYSDAPRPRPRADRRHRQGGKRRLFLHRAVQGARRTERRNARAGTRGGAAALRFFVGHIA
jgi:mannonate dehydratase